MKECEKRIEKLAIMFGSSCSPIRAEEDGFRKGWRDALKWFYDSLDYSAEHKELKDRIEEELEETTPASQPQSEQPPNQSPQTKP